LSGVGARIDVPRGRDARRGRRGARRPRIDTSFVVAASRRFLLPVCFVVLSAVRLASFAGGPIGYDGRLYRAASVAWLAGGDPWQVQAGGVYFAAPPPTLLAMIPFALVPEELAVTVLVALGVTASIWAIRRLGLPLWWLAWPPLVDGLYNANPHVFVLPLALSGAAWLGPIVKVYAAPVLLLRRQFGALLVAGVAIALTAPLLPWGAFVAQLPHLVNLLNYQSSGGLSATAVPILVIPAVAGLWCVGRQRAAWWIVPALWPSTQYYYGSLTLPAVTPIAALVLCAQFPGVAAVALVVSSVELWRNRRRSADPVPNETA
jgi:hypothetical protein